VTASLSIKNGSNNTNILTKGTTINIEATSTKSNISNIKLEMIKDGTTVAKIYENLNEGKEQKITLEGLENDLINLNKLTIFNTYTCKLTATTETGAIAEKTLSLTDYTVGNTNDLNVLATNVNKGTTYSGKTITLIEDVTTSENYIPIGYYDEQGNWTGQYFAGTFEGNNHCITLASMTTSTTYKTLGIFGMVIGGNIYNLNVKGTNDSASILTGGIVGAIKDGTIRGCTNKCSITDTTTNWHGGIAGLATNSTISSCKNTAPFIKGYSSVGGICGWIDSGSVIEDCVNGDIVLEQTISYGTETVTWKDEGKSYSEDCSVVGGIVGKCDASTVKRCTNDMIVANGDSEVFSIVGGIVGWAYNNSAIELCNNRTHVVNSYGNVAGICAAVEDSSISQSYNEGMIVGTSENYVASGGILAFGENINVNNCYNLGEVRGSSNSTGHTGGIISFTLNGGNYNNINNCYNGTTDISGGGNDIGNLFGLIIKAKGNYLSCVKDYDAYGTESNCVWGTQGAVYTQSEMSTKNDLLNLLNSGDGSGLWTRDTTGKINDGYPYLVNNVPE
jgi:hypothetical protein